MTFVLDLGLFASYFEISTMVVEGQEVVEVMAYQVPTGILKIHEIGKMKQC